MGKRKSYIKKRSGGNLFAGPAAPGAAPAAPAPQAPPAAAPQHFRCCHQARS